MTESSCETVGRIWVTYTSIHWPKMPVCIVSEVLVWFYNDTYLLRINHLGFVQFIYMNPYSILHLLASPDGETYGQHLWTKVSVMDHC